MQPKRLCVLESKAFEGIGGTSVIASDSHAETNLNIYLQSAEKTIIEEVLRQVNGSNTLAAEMLGIHPTLRYRKMKLLGMMN